ncbi:DNA methyltransferase [Propionivibrio sp.]|uniref:DNA methyltransferase n=1 Tax=Propionivibrio sp. TaxID=2212460 RepID=UPI0039E5828D
MSNNVLMNGDCLDVLLKLPARSVDFVLTDPPYLVNYKDRSGRSIANDLREEWLEPAFAEVSRVLRPNTLCASFYGWTRVDTFMAAWKRAGLRPVGHIVFAKPYVSNARFVGYRHESAFLLAKGNPALPAEPPPDVLPWKYSGNTLHPTQKPVSALVPLIKAFCPANGIVLDPFAGSGSTCIAALECGRRFIGIELDPTYYAAAHKRLADAGAFASYELMAA